MLFHLDSSPDLIRELGIYHRLPDPIINLFNSSGIVLSDGTCVRTITEGRLWKVVDATNQAAYCLRKEDDELAAYPGGVLFE